MVKSMSQHWSLDPSVTFLNHGSFGACPNPVLTRQNALRKQMEAEPVRFFEREAPTMLHDAKEALGAFLGVEARDLAFLPNATTGVNTILRSLKFGPGDEILVTEHAYGACRNAVEFVAQSSGIEVKVAHTPFFDATRESLLNSILEAISPATKLVLLDHVTSPTGLVFPVESIVEALNRRGIDCLVDGAHAPGMLPLDLSKLAAPFYVGNLHKWVCAPKGAAFLYVQKDRQPEIRPLVISHGATLPVHPKSRFELEFDWTGTDDPTAYLCVPDALRFMDGIVDGGWTKLMALNHEKVVRARSTLCEALNSSPPCPAEILGSLAAVPLSPGFGGFSVSLEGAAILQNRLFYGFDIEVPVIYWPGLPVLLIRVSAQAYNSPDDYDRLADCLVGLAHPG